MLTWHDHPDCPDFPDTNDTGMRCHACVEGWWNHFTRSETEEDD